MTSFDPKAFIQTLSGAPGIYRMLNDKGEVLYVGKARHLRNRVASYFRGQGLTTRIQHMLQQVTAMEVTVTRTESEALLLENNLIKSLRPRYNILLRDDKSYPYIFLSAHEFPRLAFHRGAKREAGQYFGPFPSASSVRESLSLLQKVFPVRQCEDSFFRNRSRPCLQYQIKRCTAPCVSYIDVAAYAQDVRHASLFLEGQSRTVIDEMVTRMEDYAAHQDYENAARYRDRIAVLRRIQERQSITAEAGDADVLAVITDTSAACVTVTFIRSGRNLGNKQFFPRLGAESEADDILSAFLPQYYLNPDDSATRPLPAKLYLNQPITDAALFEDVFSQQTQGKVQIVDNPRGLPRRWVELAELNARDALRRYLSDRTSMRQRFEALQEALALESLPERVECFDISHTQGEATVASCVVFNPEGPLKADYRRFNIQAITPGDDYAAMSQALSRRYRRSAETPEADAASTETGKQANKLPDLLLIDGGKGQLSAAEEVMQELALKGVRLVAVAKGSERKPGMEQLFLSGEEGATILPADSPALHLIQQIRDEAHRFAITGHRQRRARARTRSTLETIPGVGDKRRQALLKQLGGWQEVTKASVDDLARVPGISRGLAKRIYDFFHEEEG